MKNIVLSTLVMLITCSAIIAQDISPNINTFLEYYGKDDVAGMEKTAQEIITLAPDNYAGYAFKGYTSILKMDMPSAEKFMAIARNINPLDQATYGISAYVSFIKGNIPEAKEQMMYSFQVRPDEGLLQGTLDDISQIERITSKDLSELKNIATNANTSTSGSPAMMQKFYACFQHWNNGKECNDIANIKAYFKNLQPPNSDFSANADVFKALSYYFAQNYDGAKTVFNAYLNDNSNNRAAYHEAQAYYYLTFYDDYNASTLYLNANKGLEALAAIQPTTLLKCQLLLRKSVALGALGKADEQLKVAEELLSEAKKVDFLWMQAQANNQIGSYYLMSARTDYREKANAYITKAYQQAQQANDPSLVNSIAGNYAISLWQKGNKVEAKKVATASYDYAVKNGDFSGAQLTANNLGFMSFMQNDYDSAVQLFRKSVNITEKYRKDMSAAQQLIVMNEHSSAYGGLIMSLQKQNDVKGLFEVQDLNRSRMLREKLDKNIKSKSLSEAQKMLKQDEVLLYYSEAGPGEMVVSVITDNSASIGYNYPVDQWLQIKSRYVNKVMKQPTTLNGYVAKMNEEVIGDKVFRYNDPAQGFKAADYDNLVTITRELLQSYEPELKDTQTSILKLWYDYLIKPISAKLQNKKTLIISGEGSLNYLPFEAFVDSNGDYLIKKFNITYIPSVTAWSALQNRNYDTSRKSLLAMGGATYQDPKKNAGSVRGMDDLYEVQDAITKKINTNKNNLSEELKSLGFGGANYLAGSLREVENLQKIIPDATILTADSMKESDIKKMNASGSLANYKWLHIATHGFAMDNIPEMSGVMMTQPANGDGSEDMFLLTHEIAALDLKADLAVLSACETALGKSYGGEGINGLNSALLTAGANNTLLSLWPVSDAGTMIMMTVVYENLYSKNQTVSEAVNNAKRDMLSGVYGDQFSTPVIWAPFILSGK